MEDILRMSNREIDRLKVIQNVLSKKMRLIHAARWLRLSTRHLTRLADRVRREGNRGILHRARGRPSNNQLKQNVKDRALALIKQRYADFGPTLAHEKLKLPISRESLRQIMIAARLYHPRHRRPPHRQWRPRRPCLGELVQLDGSDHKWFEDRAPRCTLIAYIDDATSRILHAQFVPSEDTFHLFSTTKSYLLQHARPCAFYVDRDSIYRVNQQTTIDEDLQDIPPLTQFSRAMRQLDIEILPAFSPQAKGRVERLFGTLQDRLVKELRLANIPSIPHANKFLRAVYLPQHNARFARPPAAPQNAHRPLLKTHDLDAILAFQSPRVLQNDFTIQYQNRFFQLHPSQPCRLHPKMALLVEHRLDGSIHLRYKHHSLSHRIIPKRPHRPWFLAQPFHNRPTAPPGSLAFARRIQITP